MFFNKGEETIRIELDEDLSKFKTNFNSMIDSKSIQIKPYSFEILTIN